METANSSIDVSKYYDKFSSYQSKVGINIRHRSIYKNIKREGLSRNSFVLEIGCGIGTLTGLIAGVVTTGRIVSIDISPKSIEMAKYKNKKYSNIEFLVSDMSDFITNEKFDFVILADVLEHIPLRDHVTLFQRIRSVIHSRSKILINIPSPFHIEWIERFQKNALQIIDQPLYTDKFLPAIYSNNMYLYHLETYSLYFKQGDYQWIVVKPSEEVNDFAKKSKTSLRIQELKSRFFY